MRPSISQAVKVVVESGTAADVGLMVRNLFLSDHSESVNFSKVRNHCNWDN